MNALRDLWLQWRAYRSRIQSGRAFLALPHDHADPECVKWTGDRAGMDWTARCPTCNPLPVHYLTPAGGALHAFPDVLNPDNGTFDRDRTKVTCPICLGVLVS